MTAFIDLTGQRFGQLVAVRREHPPSGRYIRWVCICDCGRETTPFASHLRSGHTRSCGCTAHAVVGKANSTHRMTETRTYHVWKGMNQRCSNAINPAYTDYGGRGISVCDRWKVFENFLADMGECPTGHSIDRKDNDGNYEPDNCRWATPAQQSRNTRQNVFLELHGRRMVISDWAREIGVNRSSLEGRLRRGWPVEKALQQPADERRRRHDARP